MRLKSVVLMAFLITAALTAAACIQPLQEPSAAGAGQTTGEEKRLFVGPMMADCVGAAPQTCLLVKETPDAEYQLFYDQIEGFDYVPGREYELKVLVTERENVPADATSLHYSLLEVANETEVGPTLENTPWQLIAYKDRNGEESSSFPGKTVTADFDAGQVNGNAGCNNYFGGYVLEGTKLSIDNVGSNMMMCPDDVMNQEQDYLANLTRTVRYMIVDGQLRLADESSITVLTYVPREDIGLTGTTWNATGVNNGRGGVTSLVIGTEISAVFGADGQLSGSAGCNNYSASFEAGEGPIKIGPAASTRKMCPTPEGVMEQEREYLEALERATVYGIEGERLQLRDDGGSLQVDFRAAPGGPDAGTAPASTVIDASTSGDDLKSTLGNLEYNNIMAVEGPVQMIDGRYEGEPLVEGGAARPTAMVTDQVATGEIDGVPSAAAIIFSTSGGSGNFSDLALVQEVDGAPTNVGTVFLGDRVTVNAMEIVENRVVIDVVTQGPNDPMCCPTQRVLNIYGMENGTFAQTSSMVIGFVAPDNGATSTGGETLGESSKEGGEAGAESASLVGTTWEWIEYLDGNEMRTVPNPSQYTLLLNPEATAVVQADCNSGNGTYNLNGNSLTISIMAVTMALCEPESLSDDYLVLINTIDSYEYLDNVLVLNVAGAGGDMVFAPLGVTIDVADDAGTEAIQQTLANMEYSNVSGMEGPIQLTDGQYKGEPFVEGGASRPSAQLTEYMAVGQINGQPSAAVVLASNSGGSGTFYDLALVQEVNGVPVNVATTMLGDRTQINTLGIVDNQVLVDMVNQGPSDPMCCPTQRVINAYQLNDGEFEQTTSAVVGYVATQGDQPSAEPPAADAATTATSEPENVTRTELSPATVPSDAISLDLGGLATSYHWRVLPEAPVSADATSEPAGAPAHIVLTFDYETPTESARAIRIYPIDAYQAQWEAAGDSTITERVAALRALLAARPESPTAPLPIVPPAAGVNDLAVQVAYPDFGSGVGLRFVGRVTPDSGLVANQQLHYLFQGITDDDRYYISMVWPVAAASLTTPSAVADAAETLAAALPAAWTPTLAELDALIGSLTVNIPEAQ